jgi:hypothetical protein
VFSGVPSTAWSLVTGGDLLASTEAAGTLLVAPTSSRFRLLVAGVAAHLVISFGWAQVLARLLPKHHTATAGAVAGLGIAALDLGLVARRFPAVQRLRRGPQVLDHLAYGALVGAVLATRRGR